MTTTTVPTATREGSKVRGAFYPLQKAELLALKTAKLINNSAYVHLALRMLNPFCDRPVEIEPDRFAQDWSIPVSSVYDAIARLKRKGLIEIQRGKLFLTWNNPSTEKLSQEINNDVQNNSVKHTTHNSSEKIICNPRNDSENLEPILRSQNELLDPRINSENLENQAAKPLQDKGFEISQTIQKRSNPSEEKAGRKLKKRLTRLRIPLNGQVKEAIATYHESQVEAALKHIENTWGTIKHPLAVFLHQLPLQEIEQIGTRTRVKTAQDFQGWTLAKLQYMYPSKWKEAAIHFGVSLGDPTHE